MEEKTCSRCKRLLPLTAYYTTFYKHLRKSLIKAHCRDCQAAYQRSYRARKKAARGPLSPRTHKICSRCKQYLPVENFYRSGKYLAGPCKICKNAHKDKNRYAKTLEEAFWRNVNKDAPEKCWIWQGSLRNAGYTYGFLHFKQKRYAAHRASWIIHNGEISPGLVVCHSCDTPSCVNPHHLFLGTQKDNMADSARKGRMSKRGGRKLTVPEAYAIKQLAYDTSAEMLALLYQCDVTTIYLIWQGKTWLNIDELYKQYLKNQ